MNCNQLINSRTKRAYVNKKLAEEKGIRCTGKLVAEFNDGFTSCSNCNDYGYSESAYFQIKCNVCGTPYGHISPNDVEFALNELLNTSSEGIRSFGNTALNHLLNDQKVLIFK